MLGRYVSTKVKFTCGGEGFTVHGCQVISKGFIDILPSASLADQLLPDFFLGERLAISKLR